MKIPWRLILVGVLIVAGLLGAMSLRRAYAQTTGAAAAAQKPLYARLAWKRASPSDLEIDGDIIGGTPDRIARYATRDQLLALPQAGYIATNDANFTGPTRISGVPLDELIQALASDPKADLAVAVCIDNYKAYFSRAYIDAHHPVLVLKIDGKNPADWPKSPGSNSGMGPYLISQPEFKPNFKILAHDDEQQNPWGVVRLEFQSEEGVFNSIRPHPPGSNSQEVQDGYLIARQNCFRCHNSGDHGGTKAQRPWTVLSTWATASPDFFAAYIHDPKSKNPKSQMQAFPNYDAATLNALTKYFQSFSDNPKGDKP